MEDFLNRMIKGDDPRYSFTYAKQSEPAETGMDSGRARYIMGWVRKYREAAQKQLMAEAPARYPEFYEFVRKGIEHNEKQRLTQPLQGVGLDTRRVQRRTENLRMIQDPLPDRFGRLPAMLGSPSAGGGFSVPRANR